MTRAEMLAKVEAHKDASVGVIATESGKEICFFYKDEPESQGITRAMNEIYPQMNAGKFTDVTFIA